MRSGRAAELKVKIEKDYQKQLLLKGKQEVGLFAEDLVRGYAIDVWDEEVGRWFSLCSRSGVATFGVGEGSVAVPLEPDFGWITLALTKPPKGSTTDEKQKELSLHEALFRWANWSLVATRVGKAVNNAERPESIQNGPATDFELSVQYRVPTTPEGVLPVLRYGKSYRVRARVADLAGNVTPFGDPASKDFAEASDLQAYDRLEPGPPPELLMRNPRTEGESAERMVIRSNFDTPAAATVPSLRHVAPPKVDQFSAELHEMFDTPGGISPDSYDVIAARGRRVIRSQGCLRQLRAPRS